METMMTTIVFMQEYLNKAAETFPPQADLISIILMWGLSSEILQNLQTTLPPITFNGVLYLCAGLMGLRAIIQKLLAAYFQVTQPRPQHSINTLEYSYFYHLSIIVLVLAEVEWNMFDLAVWIGSYVGIGLIRKAIHIIKIEREIILNDYAYNRKIMLILSASKVFGIVLFSASVLYFIAVHIVFQEITIKLSSLLLFPTLMLAVDSIFLLVSSRASQTEILSYFNQNINEIPSTYKIELIEQMMGSSVRVWHYYNLIRLFIKAFIQRMGILDCMWALSIFNAAYLSTTSLWDSFKKYRSYSKLIENFNRFFRPSSSAPDQTCVICMSQLLNCRRLTSCGHLFHYKCLFLWVQTKTDCPICRAPINLHDQ